MPENKRVVAIARAVLRSRVTQTVAVLVLAPIAVVAWAIIGIAEGVSGGIRPTWRRIGKSDFWGWLLPEVAVDWLEKHSLIAPSSPGSTP